MAPSQPRNKTSSAHRSAFLRGEHSFDIVGYRARKDLGVRNTVRSADFQAGGCTWALICCFDDPYAYARRRGSGDQIQLVCITLQLVSNDGHDVVARASLRIDDPALPEKKGGPRRWPPAVWRSAEAKTFLAAAHGRGYDDDPDECTGKSYWELPVPDAFRESLYVRDDRLTIHCTVDVLQEEADEAATKDCSVSVVRPVPTP
uniref:MATH domain-containing protein n=1 Tax=Aegilops tauschii subsp. strangulata TaxID=200361 RepID=A0A453JAE4_AEGTS